MRRIERIDEICELLRKLWHNNPDMRFGQLLINYSIAEDTFRLWSQEDEPGFIEYMKEVLKNEAK